MASEKCFERVCEKLREKKVLFDVDKDLIILNKKWKLAVIGRSWEKYPKNVDGVLWGHNDAKGLIQFMRIKQNGKLEKGLFI